MIHELSDNSPNLARRNFLTQSALSLATLPLLTSAAISEESASINPKQHALDALSKALPELTKWTQELIDQSAQRAPLLKDLAIRGLEEYFPKSHFDQVRVLVVDKLPFPPLMELGLAELKKLQLSNAAAITFGNTYFVLKGHEDKPELHFHETVHTMQYKILGVEGFLRRYGQGLIENGYDNHPFEITARNLTQRYIESTKNGSGPFHAEASVTVDLLRAG